MRRLLPVGLVLAVSAWLGLIAAGPAPAQAEGVREAQARVDKLQELAKDSTRRLLEGTRQWEADQQALRRTRVDLRNAERHLSEAQAALAADQARVAAVVRSMYMNPLPGAVQLAFTQSPDEVADALQARAALNQASGSQAQVIARAATSRHRLAVQASVARTLEQRARALSERSAERMAELQALAQSTADQLTAAQSALSEARAAAARRAALARAARTRAWGGLACTGRSTAGQQNGNLDPGSLCPLWRAPGQQLRSDAAAAFNKLSQYHASTVGSPLCVTDSYRSYSDQVALYRRKPGLAAVPGTSEHGWGKAVDLCGGVQDSGSPAYRWMKANAGRFGWFHPDWAEPSGSKPEPWHWEFNG